MNIDTGILNTLFLLGVVAAILSLIYFVLRGLQQDHRTGEYHFTWGVGIVALFLMGLAPGVVGLGLYLTIEKRYPIYWLVLCLLLVAGIVGFAGIGLYTETEVTTIGTIFPESIS